MECDYSDRDSGDLRQSDPANDDVVDIEAEIRQTQLQELRDALIFRKGFFRWGVTLTSACVLFSVGFLVLLVKVGMYQTPVGVAFVSGLAVEIVGIAVVIAKYLFPDGGVTVRGGVGKGVTEENDV